jgi:nitrous oxidase accessory protein NosD
VAVAAGASASKVSQAACSTDFDVNVKEAEMKNRNTIACFAVSLLGLIIFAAPSQAAETKISGTISTTLTLTQDGELVGNVMCSVVGGPCIAFGAQNIKLRLNGFTMTGTIPGCTVATSSNDGIDVTMNDVTILGPGLIQKFGGAGVLLLSESGAKVRGITVTDSCFSGILLVGATDSEIEGNTSVRNAMGSEDNPCGGT